MDAKQFFKHVMQMRNAQSRFHRSKQGSDDWNMYLQQSKVLERECDDEIKRVAGIDPEIRELFRSLNGTTQRDLFDN